MNSPSPVAADRSPATPGLAILVSSCDRYRDLWRPFFTLFFRHWPDCPYPVYLVANHATHDDPRVTTLAVGEDRDWTGSFARALDRVAEPRVILLMEDYLLLRPVDGARVAALDELCRRSGAACVRLYPSPGPDGPWESDPTIGRIDPGSPYRLSTQAAIWDRTVLRALLREGESAWELELLGSRRTDTLAAPFLSVTREGPAPISYFCTAVVKGVWLRDALALCRREGIDVDLSARGVEPWRAFVRRRLSQIRERLLGRDRGGLA